VFLTKYALFEINGNGVTGKISADEVGESTACKQRIIYQQRIAPKFMTLLAREIETVGKSKVELVADLTKLGIPLEKAQAVIRELLDRRP